MAINRMEQESFVNLRLEAALRQQLVEEAKRSERSLNKEIVYRLRKSFEAQEEIAAA